MHSYRELQAQRWREKLRQEPEVSSPSVAAVVTPPPTEDRISIIAVDATSLESVRTYIQVSKNPRSGILFGSVVVDEELGYVSVVVDAIYECAQDCTTGEPMRRDARMAMVVRLNQLMGMRPVGILVTGTEVCAADLVRLFELGETCTARVILLVGPTEDLAIVPTTQCYHLMAQGQINRETTLAGQTVKGGVDGKTLQRSVPVVKRTVNTVIHTGFYRLNRPNHTPTLDDARAFILARRENAKIANLHLQLADYHLVLFIADAMGESTAERVVLAIYQEEDELVENLVELLLGSCEHQL